MEKENLSSKSVPLSIKPAVKAKPLGIEKQLFVNNVSVTLRNKKNMVADGKTDSEEYLEKFQNRRSKSLEDISKPVKKPSVAKKPTMYRSHLNKLLQRSETKKLDNNVWPFIKNNTQYSDSATSSSDSGNSMTNALENIFLLEYSNGEDKPPESPLSPIILGNIYDRALLVANELLMTEQNYVNKLRLIDQVFHTQLDEMNKSKQFIANEALDMIFSNTQSIYKFHESYFLPQLITCISKWNEGPELSKVMKNCAPFLKLYTDYVKNFQQANDLINSYIQKSPIFATLLSDLEKREECNNLTLQHYLLEPIQRVPRYELLLEEYCRKLPLDSVERSETNVALQLVKNSAQHINNQIHKLEEGKKLVEISSSIVGVTDLVSPHRLLLKQGKVKKVSARDASLVDRYLFLFNDIMLVCRSLPVKIGLSQQYLLRSKLDIPGMMILNGECECLENCFLVKSKQKCIEFHISSSQEMVEWLQAIYKAITVFTKKKKVPTATLR